MKRELFSKEKVINAELSLQFPAVNNIRKDTKLFDEVFCKLFKDETTLTDVPADVSLEMPRFYTFSDEAMLVVSCVDLKIVVNGPFETEELFSKVRPYAETLFKFVTDKDIVKPHTVKIDFDLIYPLLDSKTDLCSVLNRKYKTKLKEDNLKAFAFSYMYEKDGYYVDQGVGIYRDYLGEDSNTAVNYDISPLDYADGDSKNAGMTYNISVARRVDVKSANYNFYHQFYRGAQDIVPEDMKKLFLGA